MGKKQKRSGAAQAAPTQAASSKSTDTAREPDSKPMLTEIMRHPTLLLAWICLLVTLFSVGVAIRFRNDWEMGAIREPTGTIMWAAITVTLFASYFRENLRQPNRKPGG